MRPGEGLVAFKPMLSHCLFELLLCVYGIKDTFEAACALIATPITYNSGLECLEAVFKAK